MKLFTIGCSFTEGQGLKRQAIECYSNTLSEKLNIPHFNFGATGMSNDYIFRKIFELLNSNTITKNDIIIIQWTNYLRKELPVIHNDRDWYHTIPNSTHAYEDKVIKESDGSVQNKYCNQNLSEDQKKIESKNKKTLENYILQFLNEDYQLNTTKNYINSLYTYLKYYGYKHMHFFGWNECVIDSIIDNKSKFLIETFGQYSKTKTTKDNTNHPDKAGHTKWANFLYEKIIEFKYTDGFQTQLNNYKNELFRLQSNIKQDIETTNNEIIREKEANLELQIEEIKKEKQKELELIKKDIVEQLRIEEEKLQSIKKRIPKTLI